MEGREFGSKPGSGGAASAQARSAPRTPTRPVPIPARLTPAAPLRRRFSQMGAIDRRERLRKLALETIDLAKDPYFMRNHLGQYECKMCLTLHPNEGNYLAHTQGRRHQENLVKRAARDAAEAPAAPAPRARAGPRKTVKIGRPGYRVTKQFTPDAHQRSLLFQARAARAWPRPNAARFRTTH
jgi:hypothetical protein